jgi:hypothetical protein
MSEIDFGIERLYLFFVEKPACAKVKTGVSEPLLPFIFDKPQAAVL